MKNKFSVVLLLVLTICLGFLRDYIFVSINRFIDAGSDVGGRLLLMKWVLTFVFCILYLLITGAMLYVLFNDKKYIRIAVVSYVAILAVAFLSGAFGWIFSSFEHVYPFVRMVLGLAQSPLVMMVLVPAALLDIKFRKGAH